MTRAARLMSVLLFCAPASAGAADAPAVLTLNNGDSLPGELRAIDSADAIRWQGTSFVEPFEFVTSALSSVRFPSERPPAKPAGEFAFELASGDVLTGRIDGWSDEAVTLESPRFGMLRLNRSAVRRLYRLDGNPMLVYSGPSGLADWKATATDPKAAGAAWREDGPHVWTDQEQATLTADIDMPERSVIEFEISWKKSANFAFAVGIDPTSKPDSRLDGWRFESWEMRNGGTGLRDVRAVRGNVALLGNGAVATLRGPAQTGGDPKPNMLLALVCERREIADVDLVQTLKGAGEATPPYQVERNPFEGDNSDGINRTYFKGEQLPVVAPKPPRAEPDDENRIHLIAYLDQTAGTLHVFRPDGSPAGKVSVPPPERPRTGRQGCGVRLTNRRGDIRLERLRVAKWNGGLPTSTGAASRVELADGTVLSGEIVSMQDEPRRFVVRESGGERTVPAEELVATESAAGGAPERRTVAATFHDGTRISGALEGSSETELVVRSPDVNEALRAPYAELRSLVFPAKPSATTAAPPAGRVGRLEIGESRLTGRLAGAAERPGASCLAWHPDGSRTASPLKADVSGQVVYRERPKVPEVQSRPAAAPRVVRQRVIFGLGDLFGGSTDRPSANLPGDRPQDQSQPNEVHLVSGDVVPCTVTGIDELGVHISSPVVEAELLPHAKVKAVELLPGRVPPANLKAAKRERLLTVPRSQKASPPTHLLCSRTGDFLRCRLVSLDVDRVRVEVQLAEIEIPKDRVSRIIWFQPEELAAVTKRSPEEPVVAVEAPRPKPPGAGHLVQAVRPAGTRATFRGNVASGTGEAPGKENRVTFRAREVSGDVISGESDVLGACHCDVTEIDRLLLGSEVAVVAAELAYGRWRLHPAVEPLVAQDFDESGTADGNASPLVGAPAPEIALDLLAGGSFRLSKCKGQIVVLDFWASWCGPCIQTMPMTEEVMREFDPAQVRLVTVNLEEPAEHVKSVMERHKLAAPVALDLDGVAARLYQADAIPQLVIVGRDGNVAKVYVGGGRAVVERLKDTLGEMLGGAATPGPDLQTN